jgi:hypothetical protein
VAAISLEIAQIVIAEDEGEKLPAWFLVELVRDLPQLVEKAEKKA